MKSIKLFTIGAALAQMLSCSPKQAMNTSIYAQAMEVTYINEERNLVVFQDSNGDEYGMFDIADWYVGDIAALIMDDAGTPNDVTDDLILSARYTGYTR